MRYSSLIGKAEKEPPGNADSANAKLLEQAGFVQKQMAGVYNYLPLGMRTLTKIKQIVREEMDALGAQEILMPALTQVDSWKQTNRHEMDVLFHLKGRGESDYVLNPTHEEIVTPLMIPHVRSYKDLPTSVYQIQDKFRNEPRAKSGLLRGREFSMKDLYSYHESEEDLDEFYERAASAYHTIFDRIGIGDITVRTFASGGVFSKYSHEFQTLSDVGEDTIYLCEDCNIAVNKELIEEQDSCPDCENPELKEKKGIEVGNIFKLRTRFSEAFNLTFVGRDGKRHPVEMGCYGIGPSRMMGTVVEALHDENGIVWPQSIAPHDVHLLGLGRGEVVDRASETYAKLKEAGIDVLFDDRTNVSAGQKLMTADLVGIPNRVVLSGRTLEQKSVELKQRTKSEPELVPLEHLISSLS